MKLAILALLVLIGCSRHFEAKVDASQDTHQSVDATKHETVTRAEQPTKIVTVIRKPDGTVKERTIYKGAVDVKRQIEADAKSLLDTAAMVHSETEKDSKPFGIFAFLSAFWPWLLAAIPVLVFLFRNKLGPILKLLPFPFSLIAPKE